MDEFFEFLEHQREVAAEYAMRGEQLDAEDVWRVLNYLDELARKAL